MSDFVAVDVEEYKILVASKDRLIKIISIFAHDDADTQTNVDELINSIRLMNEEFVRMGKTYAC